MKFVVMLSLGTLLSVFAWIVAIEQIRPQNLSAIMQPDNNKVCNHRAIVREYYSLKSKTVCAYILEVDNGDIIRPMDLPKNFHLHEGQTITVNYNLISASENIYDCNITSKPVMAATILCINELIDNK